jgi:hypothetical protein
LYPPTGERDRARQHGSLAPGIEYEDGRGQQRQPERDLTRARSLPLQCRAVERQRVLAQGAA